MKHLRKINGSMIVKPAIFFDIIQEWDGTLNNVTALVTGKGTIIVYEDGVAHKVSNHHYMNELYYDVDMEKEMKIKKLGRQKARQYEDELIEQLCLPIQ